MANIYTFSENEIIISYLLYFGLGVIGPTTSLGSLRPAMFLALTRKSYGLSFFKPFTVKPWQFDQTT